VVHRAGRTAEPPHTRPDPIFGHDFQLTTNEATGLQRVRRPREGNTWRNHNAILNRHRTREARARRGRNVQRIGTASSAAISPNLRARPASVLPDRAQGDVPSVTPRGRRVSGRAGRVTLPRRPNTREMGEAAPSSVAVKVPTAGCG